MLNPSVVLLGTVYFGLAMTMNTVAVWTPQIVHEMLLGRAFWYVGVVAAIPAVFTAIAGPLWSADSDRRSERIWHTILPMTLGAAGWLLVALFTMPEVRMLGLTCATVGSFSTMSIFWTFPPTVLSLRARPAGVAVVNCCGNLASAASPLLVGFFKDLTHSFAGILLFQAAVLVGSAGLVLTFRKRRISATAQCC